MPPIKVKEDHLGRGTTWSEMGVRRPQPHAVPAGDTTVYNVIVSQLSVFPKPEGENALRFR